MPPVRPGKGMLRASGCGCASPGVGGGRCGFLVMTGGFVLLPIPGMATPPNGARSAGCGASAPHAGCITLGWDGSSGGCGGAFAGFLSRWGTTPPPSADIWPMPIGAPPPTPIDMRTSPPPAPIDMRTSPAGSCMGAMDGPGGCMAICASRATGGTEGTGLRPGSFGLGGGGGPLEPPSSGYTHDIHYDYGDSWLFTRLREWDTSATYVCINFHN